MTETTDDHRLEMPPKTRMSDDKILERLHLMVDAFRGMLEISRNDNGRFNMYPSYRVTFSTDDGEAVVLFLGLDEPTPDDSVEDDNDNDNDNDNDEGC